MKTIKDIKAIIETTKPRSAWDNGVKLYALDLLSDMDDSLDFYGSPTDKKTLLNGADSWEEFSQGGCALIYDRDIAERTCTQSELKKTKNGERNPNNRETWLDVQSRALFQSSNRIVMIAKAD